MKREDIEKLLGGYATGTLSEVERKALLEAALEDQELFNAVADETALKELLDDPQAREYLLRALPVREKSLIRRFPAWSWAAAGAVAATLVIAVVEVRAPEPRMLLARRGGTPLNAPSKLKSAAQLPADAEQEQVVVPNKPAKRKAALIDALAKKAVSVEIAAAQPKLAQPSSLSPPSAARPQSAIAENNAVLPGVEEAKPGARALFYAASEMAFQSRTGSKDAAVAVKPVGATFARPAGIRYTVLRQQPDGTVAEVEPDTVFRAGDQVRLGIETNAPGNLLVRDGDTELANFPAVPRTKYTVPADGAIELSGPPGTRKLTVVFSPAQDRAPEPVTAAPLVERSSEGATYIAELQPGRRFSFEIILVHQ